jgi:hypothetical protein
MAQRHTTTTTTTTRRTARPKRSLFGRRKKVVHQKRKPTLGDKVAGAVKKLKGTILGRPGEKVGIYCITFRYPAEENVLTQRGHRLLVRDACMEPMVKGQSDGDPGSCRNGDVTKR